MSKNNENKLVPKLRFPEFQNEDDWRVDEVGNVFDVTRGYVLSMNLVSEEQTESNPYPVYSSQTKNKGLAGYYKDFLYEDAITWTTDGANAGDVNFRLGKFYCTNVCGVLVNSNGFANPCIAALINSVSRKHVSYVGNPKLMNGVMSKIKIPFPKIKEQQKIAACLSSLDEVITAESQKLGVLKDHKRGLLQNLLPVGKETIPKLRFKEFQNADEWNEDTLANIASFRRGSFPQPYGLPKWYDDENGMPFIQVFDVGEDFRLKPTTKRKISSLAAEQSVFIPKGTLIITIQGSIGRVAITQYDAYIDRTLLLFEEFYQEVDITFFAYTIFLLFEIEKQKAPGGIIKTITKEVLSSFVVKLPSIEEQQKIASCLTSLDELISAQTEKIESLQLHKKGLLQGLFPNVNEVTE